MLGAPWLSSDQWGFDAYRVADVSRQAAVLMITIWPIPLGVLATNEEGYVLVVYGETGVVSHFAAGRHRQKGGFGFESVTGDLGGSRTYSEILDAGRLALGIEPRFDPARRIAEAVPFVLADAASARAYLLSRRSLKGCTLVLSCEDKSDGLFPGCGEAVVDRMGVDVQPVALPCTHPASHCSDRASAPSRRTSRVPVLVPIALPPGKHEILPAALDLSRRTPVSFACKAGEVKYGAISAWWIQPARNEQLGPVRAEIELTSAMPDTWEARGLMIYRNGRWSLDSAD